MRWRRRKSCERFAAWLDSGRPAAGATEVLGHAAECAECAARATAESELEALLASAPPPAPPGFTTAVMARVSATRPQPVLLSPNLLPLWVRAVADPACALPLVASALLLGGFDRIPELEGVIASLKSALVETLGARAPRLLDAGIWTAAAVSLVPTLVLVSIALYRYSVRQVYASALAGFRR